MIATEAGVQNAHRVLRANGQVSPGWVSSEGDGPEHARALLEAEGVVFDDAGIADLSRRWTPDLGSSTPRVEAAGGASAI